MYTDKYYKYYKTSEDSMEEPNRKKKDYKSLQQLYVAWAIIGLFTGPILPFALLFTLGIANHYVSEHLPESIVKLYIKFDASVSIVALCIILLQLLKQ